MPSHNPECTHGGAHGPAECRDRYARHLKPLEDPISVPEAGQLTDADREALRVALAGLAPISVDQLRPAHFSANLGSHDPYRDPDADADAAQRAE